MCLNYPLVPTTNSCEEIKQIYNKLLEHYAISHLFFIGISDKDNVFSKYTIQKNSTALYGMQSYEYQTKDFINTLLQKEYGEFFAKQLNYQPKELEELIIPQRKWATNWCQTQQGLAEELHTMILCNIMYPISSLTKHLSCNFGDHQNKYLLPHDKNTLLDKPFILCKKLNSCISPFIISQGYTFIAPIWDKWLIENNTKYSNKKGMWLEDKVYKICKQVFGEDNCYLNKYFEIIDENSKPVRVELDLVVIYGSFILYFECKSNRINDSRDTDQKYHDTVNKDNFIGKAGMQINRFYDYCQQDSFNIYESDKPSNTNHKNIKSIEGKFIFIPCLVTMESFDYLDGNSTVLKDYLKKWKDLDLISMIFNIFDLETISKILNKDYLFVDYLLQKYFLHTDKRDDHSLVKDGNEKDQLSYYTQRGQIPYIKFYDLPNSDVAIAVDRKNQHYIDNFFIETSDPNKKVEKPQRTHDPLAEQLLEWIENESPFIGSTKKLAKQWFLAYYNSMHSLVKQFSFQKFVDDFDPSGGHILSFPFPDKEQPRSVLFFCIITPENHDEMIKLVEQSKTTLSLPFMIIFYYIGFPNKTFDIRAGHCLSYPYNILLPR